MIQSEGPRVTPKGQYSVTQACALLGIHRNSLRKYTNNGWIRCVFSKVSGRKYYLGSGETWGQVTQSLYSL